MHCLRRSLVAALFHFRNRIGISAHGLNCSRRDRVKVFFRICRKLFHAVLRAKVITFARMFQAAPLLGVDFHAAYGVYGDIHTCSFQLTKVYSSILRLISRTLTSAYNTGITTSVSTVEEIIPPIIGAAMRLITSEPVPVPHMIGNSPAMMAHTVIMIGR